MSQTAQRLLALALAPIALLIFGACDGAFTPATTQVVHEVGHMRQDLVNPAQTEFEGALPLAALQEVEAQQFQRTFWLTLERFTGLSILAYPDYDDFRRFLDERLERWQAKRTADSLGCSGWRCWTTRR